jgi:hypothetical protein
MELLVAIPFCCLGVFTLLGFGLVILMISRQSQPYSTQEKAKAEAAAETYLSQTVPTLLPWTPSALADLSCQWQGTRGGFTIGQYQGLVKSLSKPDGPGLLAYYLSLKGRRGFLRLRTSEPFDPSTRLRTGPAQDRPFDPAPLGYTRDRQDRPFGVYPERSRRAQDRREVRLDIEANEVRVSVEGQPLGSVHLHEGTIFDSGGQPIGRYHRYRGLRWQVGSAPTSSRYGPLELHGRTVAEVNDGLVRSGGLLTGSAASRPLVRNLAADPTPEEENWLLALVALELYHSALRHRNRSRSV